MEKLAICEYYDEYLHITQFTDEVKIIPEVRNIDLSTKDFTLIAGLGSGNKTLVDKVKYPNSVIKDDEIFKFIRELYNTLTINNNKVSDLKYVNFPLRFKHIRFYRITIDKFIVTDNFNNTIDYKSLLKSALNSIYF